MARRRSSRVLVYGIKDPRTLGSEVVSRYVEKGRTDLPAWTRSYRSSVGAYLGNTAKQEIVKSLVGAWYEIFITTVHPALVETYARAKGAYGARKAEALRRAAPPAPPAPGV